MKKRRVLRLTESQLKRIVKSFVNESMEEDVLLSRQDESQCENDELQETESLEDLLKQLGLSPSDIRGTLDGSTT
jgi:hypothetical protein